MQFSMKLVRGIGACGLLLAGVLATSVAWAEPGQDHPEVARFPGAEMIRYDFKEYEEFQLILSKPVNRNSEWTADKTLALEGRVTFIYYKVPKAASPLQVFRNYQSSLRRSGFADLFVCERPCTTTNLSSFEALMKTPKHYLNYSTDNQFIAAQRGNTYVSLWVNDGGVWLHVVEKESLNDSLMDVRGESPIAKSLSQDGKVDLYGFQFDTGKAVLKDGSKTTLQELGKVLQDNPTLSVEVMGHTDDVGGPEANQRLSEARATAVADALTKNFGIAPTRMSAQGMGQTVPLMPNTNEAGRAKNRRVEIIANMPAAALTPPPATTSVPPSQAQKPRAPGAGQQAVAPSPPPSPAPEPKNGNLIEDAGKAIDAAKKLKGLFGF